MTLRSACERFERLLLGGLLDCVVDMAEVCEEVATGFRTLRTLSSKVTR